MDTYAFEAELTRISAIGLAAEGIHIDVGFTGSITEGQLTGCAIEGIDHLLIRPDGVGVIYARELISNLDRAIAAIRAEGYIVPPLPMPELLVLADPNFQWPDVDLPLHGAHFGNLRQRSLYCSIDRVRLHRISEYCNPGTQGVGARLLKPASPVSAK
jgi:hypothetical protein